MTTEQEQLTNAARVRRLRRTVTRLDLAAGVANGASVDVPLTLALAAATAAQLPPSNFLPADALHLGAPLIRLTQQFTGGGATSVGVTLGTAAAPALIATTFDVFGSAASGLAVDMSRGAQRVVPAGGQLFIARFVPDAGHALASLTGGACTIEVYFCVPDGARP